MPKERHFLQMLKKEMKDVDCRWYPLCRGGCRRDLIPYGNEMRNRYCEAYQKFFQTVIGRLEYLASICI